MYDEQRKSPPLSETNGVVNMPDKGGGNVPADTTLPATADETFDKTLTDANSSPEISYLVPPYKFTKYATTDDIVNVDADIIDIDSFKYVNKDSLVKALLYLIKNVDQVNKDLSSVKLPARNDSACDVFCDKASCADLISSSTSSNLLNNQVDDLSVILTNFQHSLLKSVDEKLSVVDEKLSNALSHLPNDTTIKTFSDVAAKAAKKLKKIAKTNVNNVENIAKNTVDNVENVAKQSINIMNSTSSSSKSLSSNSNVEIIGNNAENTSFDVFISNSTVLKAQEKINDDVMVLNPANPHGAYVQSKLDNTKNSIRNKLKKVPFEFANDKSKTGKIALRFPNADAYNKAEEAIDTAFLASIGHESKRSTKMLPKISLKGIPSYLLKNINISNLSDTDARDAKKEEIITQLRDKNPCIDNLVNSGHTFQVVFISSHTNGDDLTVGLKVSPLIRYKILTEQNGYVFIGGKRCLFSDRFDIGQCYHCQLLGHNSQKCPNKGSSSTCLYCMGNHRSADCTAKNQLEKHCCAKCNNSSVESESQNYKSHNSASPECPVFIRECQRLANITDFSSKNVL